jgi:hypothetical protein
MLKQLVITLALLSFFGAFALAQENTEMVKKEKQECSKSCCAKKEMHSDMNSNSMDHNSIVREGEIDLSAIDENGDGKVYQDQMCWNVVSDESGECPLCGMKLKEITIEEAKNNLEENGFDVK